MRIQLKPDLICTYVRTPGNIKKLCQSSQISLQKLQGSFSCGILFAQSHVTVVIISQRQKECDNITFCTIPNKEMTQMFSALFRVGTKLLCFRHY